MYFLNSKSLTIDLIQGSISQREVFSYYLGTTIISAIQVQWVSFNSSSEISLSAIIFALIYIGMITSGSVICFESNQKGDGVNFIERYVCLSFPLTIRIILLNIAIQIVLYLLIGVVVAYSPFILIIYFYYLMNYRICFIAKHTEK